MFSKINVEIASIAQVQIANSYRSKRSRAVGTLVYIPVLNNRSRLQLSVTLRNVSCTVDVIVIAVKYILSVQSSRDLVCRD